MTNKSKKILTEISAGELLDKISILEIKLDKINDKEKLMEKNSDFSENFIQLSRNVYINNDKRAKIKSDINNLLGSNIKEVKSY